MIYLKLVRFECRRFFPIYLGLLAFLFIGQLLVVFRNQQIELNLFTDFLAHRRTIDDFLLEHNPFTMASVGLSSAYQGALVITLATIGLYALFIWYRDWYGKNTFIYRLLMLPNARVSLFWAKFTTIALLGLGIIAWQIALVPIQQAFYMLRFPNEIVTQVPIYDVLVNVNPHLFVHPTNMFELVTLMQISTLTLLALFIMIVIERAYHVKGIMYALIYGVGMYYVLISFIASPIYSSERFIMNSGIFLIAGAINLTIAHHFMKTRITI